MCEGLLATHTSSHKIIRPPLHQLHPVGHVRGPVIHGADFVLLPARDLPFDQIGVPAVLVGHFREQGPESVCRGDACSPCARALS